MLQVCPWSIVKPWIEKFKKTNNNNTLKRKIELKLKNKKGSLCKSASLINEYTEYAK